MPLQNGSFEKGLEGWDIEAAGNTAKALPEAALLGGQGLRVHSPGAAAFSLSSAPLEVKPGKTYTVTFWAGTADGAKAAPGAVDVKMIFKDAAGKELTPAMASIRKWPATTVKGQPLPVESSAGGRRARRNRHPHPACLRPPESSLSVR